MEVSTVAAAAAALSSYSPSSTCSGGGGVAMPLSSDPVSVSDKSLKETRLLLVVEDGYG